MGKMHIQGKSNNLILWIVGVFFLNWYKKKITFEKLHVRNIWVCEIDNLKLNQSEIKFDSTSKENILLLFSSIVFLFVCLVFFPFCIFLFQKINTSQPSALIYENTSLKSENHTINVS